MITQDLLPQPDYQTITTHFLEELQKASRNEPSSIAFLKNNLPKTALIDPTISTFIQGIVIGGTNYIAATQQILPGKKPQLVTKTTGKLPVLKNKQVLISFLQKHIDPQATALGINFGFPLEPTTGPHGELDGKLYKGTKEHLFTEVIGENIGDIAREAIKKDIPITVANDTICLTLVGNGTEDGAIIAGTGFNIGLIQQETIINLEAGNFDKFPPTEILTMIDAASDIQGKQLFEKVISGKYLAEYFNYKAKKLHISHHVCQTSQDLSRLSQETNDDEANKLARAILERSARLVACSFAAIYHFLEEKPLTFIGEGSLLWKGWNYTTNIQQQLHAFGLPDDALTIKRIKDSSINGALGLLLK